jgi:predicted DNA-binding transcriptional regulator YafY
LRQDYRTFRLTRIKECRTLEERFAPRGVTLQELDARWDAADAASPQIRMVLRFHPRLRVRVEEYFPPEEIAVDDEGYYRVDTVHAEDEWLYGTLLSFGPDVTVLEPARLAADLKRRALQIAGLYE